MSGPYRDDAESLRAQVAAAEHRAARAEARARVAEAALARKRRGLWLTAGPGELLVVHGSGGLQFLTPGESMLGLRVRVFGALPAAQLAVHLPLRGVAMRGGAADLDLTTILGIGADPERREKAVRQFLDRTVYTLGEIAMPVLEASGRSILGVRSVSDLVNMGRLVDDVRLSTQAALRDLGLDVGDVFLTRA